MIKILIVIQKIITQKQSFTPIKNYKGIVRLVQTNQHLRLEQNITAILKLTIAQPMNKTQMICSIGVD